ncbi:MAG TPA: Mut7-C RNAse domain-containing protein [Terriglobales bacterium]|nr:Mut7-C RNAse domain-containing protein [Terriglobales bacterium]
MKRAEVRFYSELNEFLAPQRRGRTTPYAFAVSGSVKDLIEALGVPHTEVDLILVNGESVDFSYRVKNGDRISVFPQFETMDISPLVRLRPQPLRESRFVADAHLGRLAAYLRMAGFDTAYRRDYADEELANISAKEKRILLTRDRGLLKRNRVTRGYCVRTTNPRDQFAEVLQRFDLSRAVTPFQRCVRCNELLVPTHKELISDRLQPETKQHYEEFTRCPACNRIYWKGSHYRRMKRFLESVIVPERGVSRG